MDFVQFALWINQCLFCVFWNNIRCGVLAQRPRCLISRFRFVFLAKSLNFTPCLCLIVTQNIPFVNFVYTFVTVGKILNITTPIISFLSINPTIRLSSLSFTLSPITKYVPSGTVVSG